MIYIKIWMAWEQMDMETKLELPEEISIANIGEWKGRLLAVLQDSASVSIDATDLSRVIEKPERVRFASRL